MRRSLVNPAGILDDFVPRPGDPSYAEQRGGQSMRWGNRALIALNPDPRANPNLYGQQSARNSATVLQVSDLGRCYPVSIQVRWAPLVVGTGQPNLPFTDLNPRIGGPLDPEVAVVFKIRRGVDELAPPTDDVYYMRNANTKFDCAPFDVITARSLGIEVSLMQPLGTPAQNLLCNIWVEIIATVLDDVSARARLPGYFEVILSPAPFVPASPVSVLLCPAHNSRAQVIICNTSTDADLWINFGSTVIIPNLATMVLPKGIFATYESPIGGFTGPIYGIWNAAAPTGGALVMEGSRKSAINP